MKKNVTFLPHFAPPFPRHPSVSTEYRCRPHATRTNQGRKQQYMVSPYPPRPPPAQFVFWRAWKKNKPKKRKLFSCRRWPVAGGDGRGPSDRRRLGAARNRVGRRLPGSGDPRGDAADDQHLCGAHRREDLGEGQVAPERGHRHIGERDGRARRGGGGALRRAARRRCNSAVDKISRLCSLD